MAARPSTRTVVVVMPRPASQSRRDVIGGGVIDPAMMIDTSTRSDDLAVEVHERAAAVARVDGRIGLQELLVLGQPDVAAALAADDAGADGVIELLAERAADGEHPVTDTDGVGVPERHGRQRLAECQRLRPDLKTGLPLPLNGSVGDGVQVGAERRRARRRKARQQFQVQVRLPVGHYVHDEEADPLLQVRGTLGDGGFAVRRPVSVRCSTPSRARAATTRTVVAARRRAPTSR